MSVGPVEERASSADAVAGFLATIALIAVAMGGRHARLATWAVAVVTVGWVAGMIVAVVTESPVY
jgi:hypothetical protein